MSERPKLREAILEFMSPTSQFRQANKVSIGIHLAALGFDRADEEAWVSGALAVLIEEGSIIEDPYSSVVSYYISGEWRRR